jgi:membrane protein DedA with SNARE-associated domain
MGHVLAVLADFIKNTIGATGYLGVIMLSAIESANIPLPSEIILPFAGYLVSAGRFSLWLVAGAGAVGNVIGSVFSYYVGMYGGRPLVERFGKYVLMSKRDLDMADRWFARWGEATAFFSRCLPVIRTFISFPAGIARVNVVRFMLYSLVGSYIWSLFLAYIGMQVGENIEVLKPYFHKADALIGVLIVAGVALYVWRHVKHAREDAAEAEATPEAER